MLTSEIVALGPGADFGLISCRDLSVAVHPSTRRWELVRVYEDLCKFEIEPHHRDGERRQVSRRLWQHTMRPLSRSRERGRAGLTALSVACHVESPLAYGLLAAADEAAPNRQRDRHAECEKDQDTGN
jgi:hypothetical protein